MHITSKQGQWLGDLAATEAGSIEAIFEMAVANGISITDVLPIGTVLVKPSPIDKRMISYYGRNNIVPATEYVERSEGEGLEYWTLENDFILG